LVKLKKVLKRALRVRDRRDDPDRAARSDGLDRSDRIRIRSAPAPVPAPPSCHRLLRHLRREREASGGNNTLAGAHTPVVLMTVLHTGRKRGIDFIAVATNALRDPSAVDSMFL
jgi:hypothetical protein